MRALREDKLGRYELLIELGRGGMAELFLARLRGVGGFEKVVAIKRILPHLAQDPQFKDLFLNEGRIAAALMHPNVCQVFELEEADGELYLAMEYLEGVSWDHLIASTPRSAALRLTAAVLAQACEGLHYAHSLHDIEGRPTPVIHRDVSPQNLFVTVDGICKVLDFGVSKMMTDGPRTRTGVIKGKLPYMAPEQIRGDHDIDGRADVFSLGVCAWEALAGRRLFDRETDFAIWKAITEEDAPFVRAYWPECPPLVDDVIRRALDRDRDRRPRSAREFGQLLGAAAGVAATSAEIAHVAEAVRVSCGEKLMLRRQQVATAVSSKRESADTFRDGDMRLRSEVRRVDREAASTVDALPRAKEQPEPPPARRRPILMMIAVAVLAAGLAAGIVAIVMSRKSSPAAAPVAQPTAEGSAAASGSAEDWGVDDINATVGSAQKNLREGLEEVRKAGEDLRKLREQFHGSN